MCSPREGSKPGTRNTLSSLDYSINTALSYGPARLVKPARVVFLLQDLKFGGTQRQTLELTRRLDPARFRPEIWLMAAGDDLVPPAQASGLPLTWLSRQEQVGPRSLLNLWRRLRRGGLDLLVLLTVVPNIWGRIMGRLARVSIILGNCRGGGSPGRQGERWLWPLADHIICNSAALKRVLTGRCGVPEARLSVILNGVDSDYFRPSPDAGRASPAVALSVARMVPDKDPANLIKAFARVAAAFPQAQVWLVGEGPLLPAIRQMAQESLPRDSFRFLAPQVDLRPLFRQAGLLVLSSRTEALPNVVLEAMAAGLPVAATAVGDVPEMVRPARTGWLAPPGDPAALAAAMGRLLENPADRQAFGLAARRRVRQEFSLDAMVRRHEEVFQDLLLHAHHGDSS